MKRMRKSVALLLAVLLCFTTFSVAGPIAAFAENDIAEFTDEFDGGLSSLWQTKIPGKVLGGVYYTERGTVNRLNVDTAGRNYYVEAEVAYTRYFDGFESHTGYTSIAGCYDGEHELGYEFGIGAPADGDALAAYLVKRTESGAVVLKMAENVGEIGAFYRLRMIFKGENIYCYIDGQLIFEADDTTYTTGLPAIYTGNAAGAYKYFTYKGITDSDISNVARITAARRLVIAENTAVEDIPLDIKAVMFDGTTRPLSNSEVSVSGYSGAKGVYNIKADYHGLTATTLVYVTNDVGSMLFDDFSSGDLTANGWQKAQSNDTGVVTDGKYYLKDINSVASSADWTNVLVEATVYMSSETTRDNASMGIFARANDYGKAVEFTLTKSGDGAAARLFMRGVSSVNGVAVDYTDFLTDGKYAFNTEYRLRLEIFGSVIKAYVNGDLVFEAYGGGEINAAGYAGVRNVNGYVSGYVDNFEAVPLKANDFSVKTQAIAEGTDPDAADINLDLQFSNTLSSFNMSSKELGAVISGYDPAVPGVQEITVSYGGTEKTAKAEIISAEDYAVLTGFINDVNSVRPMYSNLRTYSKDAIRGFTATYSNMGETSRNAVPEHVYFRYMMLISRMEQIVYSDVRGYDLMFFDSFENLDNYFANSYWKIDNNRLKYCKPSDSAVLAYKGSAAKVGAIRYVSGTVTVEQAGGYIGFMALCSGYYNYLFRAVSSGDGKMGVQLLKANETGAYNTIKTDYSGEIANTKLGDVIRISATFIDGKINVYVNDVLNITYTDTDLSLFYTASTVKIRCVKSEAYIDDLMVLGELMPEEEKVYDYTEEDVSFAAGNDFADDFNDEVDGTSPDYWIEAVNSDEWTVTGNAAGNDYFTEDFSGDALLTEKGWSAAAELQDGKLKLTNGNIMLDTPAALAWTDYVAECEVSFDTEDDFGGYNTAASALVVRSSSKGDGYECGILLNKNGNSSLRIYDRVNKKTLASVRFATQRGVTYRMKVVVKGDYLCFYVDGIAYLALHDSTYTCGTIRLSSGPISAIFDDLSVHPENRVSAEKSAYYSVNTNSYSQTWLHVFEVSPRVSAKVRVNEVRSGSRVGLLGRYAVEGSFVRGGYDFDGGKWYIEWSAGLDFPVQYLWAENTSDFSAGVWHNVDLVISNEGVYISFDGELVLSGAIDYMSYGRIGLFGDNVQADFDDISAYMPSGVAVDKGIFEYEGYPSGNQGSVREVEDNILLFYSGRENYKISYDGGATFVENSTGSYTLPSGLSTGYTSGLRLRSGKFIELLTNFSVVVSDDHKTWETRGTVVPADERKDEYGNTVAIWHIASMTEVDLGNGHYRIFLPIAMRICKSSGTILGHYTRVFYSDDEGWTWTESENDTRSLTDTGSTIAETKVVKCSDGSLRLYVTRTDFDCASYAESLDNGVTWSGFYMIPSMPCPKSSFGVAEDFYNPGTYYLAYVKDISSRNTTNSIFPRTEVVLTKSTDGKNWTEVMSLDHFTSLATELTSELYQILDPSVTITEDYIYVCFGRSNAYGSGGAHNHQTVRYARVEKTNNVTVASELSGVSVSADRNTAAEGETVTVTVTPKKGRCIDAGAITYSYYDNGELVTKNIINQPSGTIKGRGLGYKFYFRMPAADVTISAAATPEDTNFSIGAIATSYKRDNTNALTGIRFLSRFYLPTDSAGNFKLDVRYNGNDYAVTSFGSLIIPENVLGDKTLDISAVTDPSLRAMKSEAYPSGSLYDFSSRYIDFTVVMDPAKAGRIYVVRAYVELDDGLGNKTYVYSDILKRGLPS